MQRPRPRRPFGCVPRLKAAAVRPAAVAGPQASADRSCSRAGLPWTWVMKGAAVCSLCASLRQRRGAQFGRTASHCTKCKPESLSVLFPAVSHQHWARRARRSPLVHQNHKASAFLCRCHSELGRTANQAPELGQCCCQQALQAFTGERLGGSRFSTGSNCSTRLVCRAATVHLRALS